MNAKEELLYTIDRDSQLLEGTLNLIIGNMTIAEIKNHLQNVNRVETYLEKNLLKLKQMEDLDKNNTKLEDFKEEY